MSQAGASKGGKMRLAVDGAGFYDLMVAVDNDAVFGDGKQAEMANFLIRLGYDAVAYNVSAAAPLAKQHRCQIKACPTEHAGAPAAPDRKKRPAPAALRIDTKPAFQQLTRLTVAVEDATHVHAVDISNEVAGTYDLLAVRPLSERVFELACKSMRVDIISLDLSRRLPFYLKIPLIKAAIARGIYFEITYSPCLRDAGARRQLFGNALQLVRATRGHHVILSSDADRRQELRSPHDVINLSHLFGLGHGGKGQKALDTNPSAVVRLARQRRGIDSTTARLVSVNKELAHKMWSGTKFAPANADAGQSERGGGDSLDADLMLPSSSEEGDGDGAESEGGEDGDKAEDESEDASAKDDEESAAEEDSEEGGEGAGQVAHALLPQDPSAGSKRKAPP